MQTQRFFNKVVVVTGAAQGIGEGVALQAAREGAQLVLVDRSELLSDVLEAVQALGAEAIMVLADLETFAGAESAMAAAKERFGRIDVLINNVGGAIWMKPYDAFSEEETNYNFKLLDLTILAFATSIDAFAIGMTFAFLEVWRQIVFFVEVI